MKQIYINFLFAFILFSACNNNGNPIPSDCTNIHWSYTGENGPEHWPDLCTGFSACGHSSQSPINITNVAEDTTLAPIVLNYGTTKVEIENNGHTIEFECEPGSTLSIGKTTYELLQFHYHGLSEHKVEGQHYPLEVHFVNKSTEDNYVVIAIFYEVGDENPLFNSFLAHFPLEEGTYVDHTKEIDLSALFPDDKSYYNYSGSLTTPPCSEIVNWFVLKNSITASSSQIAYFQEILQNNYRPVQDLNGRKVSLFIE